MNKLVFAAVAAASLGMAAPASAQFFVGADPYGAGVRSGRSARASGPASGADLTAATAPMRMAATAAWCASA